MTPKHRPANRQRAQASRKQSGFTWLVFGIYRCHAGCSRHSRPRPECRDTRERRGQSTEDLDELHVLLDQCEWKPRALFLSSFEFDPKRAPPPPSSVAAQGRLSVWAKHREVTPRGVPNPKGRTPQCASQCALILIGRSFRRETTDTTKHAGADHMASR